MTRIAELQDRLRRLAKRREGEGIYTDAAICEEAAEALSRTGAVKVKALEWEERKTRLGTVWWSAPNPLGGLSIEAASESDKIAAQADYEHRILSALEPAAPEDQQEPVAWVSEQSLDNLHKAGSHVAVRTAIHRQPLKSGNGVALYTRPAEQAVTEAMVEAAASQLGFGPADSVRIRAALKAAMEADR